MWFAWKQEPPSSLGTQGSQEFPLTSAGDARNASTTRLKICSVQPSAKHTPFPAALKLRGTVRRSLRWGAEESAWGGGSMRVFGCNTAHLSSTRKSRSIAPPFTRDWLVLNFTHAEHQPQAAAQPPAPSAPTLLWGEVRGGEGRPNGAGSLYFSHQDKLIKTKPNFTPL